MATAWAAVRIVSCDGCAVVSEEGAESCFSSLIVRQPMQEQQRRGSGQGVCVCVCRRGGGGGGGGGGGLLVWALNMRTHDRCKHMEGARA